MPGDQVPRDPEVLPPTADCLPLEGRLHGDGGVGDVPPLLDLDLLHLVVAEDVRYERLGNNRELDDEDLPVHQPPELRDVLALLPDRASDVPRLDDVHDAVRRVEAVHDRRAGNVLEEGGVSEGVAGERDFAHWGP